MKSRDDEEDKCWFAGEYFTIMCPHPPPRLQEILHHISKGISVLGFGALCLLHNNWFSFLYPEKLGFFVPQKFAQFFQTVGAFKSAKGFFGTLLGTLLKKANEEFRSLGFGALCLLHNCFFVLLKIWVSFPT